MREDDEILQVCMNRVIFDHLQDWLSSKGLRTVMDEPDPDDLPTYFVVLK